MRMEPAHEAECRRRIDANRNMLVPWYLMASHAYHWMDHSIISDALYDEICQRLLDEWDTITHWHKEYIDHAALPHRSGNYLTSQRIPQRAFWALQALLRSPAGSANVDAACASAASSARRSARPNRDAPRAGASR